MRKLFKRITRILIKCCLLLAIVTASYYTPIFSSVALFVLNRLPVPDAAHRANDTADLTVNPQANVTNGNVINVSDAIDNNPISASAYVVLGGGLTNDTVNNTNDIVLNAYSVNRLQTVLNHYKNSPLPIVLTGVESAWMHDWLLDNNIEDVITENASMNTCENARFTAKLLSLSDTPISSIYLVTDPYHMTRARRQFALSGINSIALAAPLPTPKRWSTPSNNKEHSRRALYELVAYGRDVIAPQPNCRQAADVSMDTLRQSRKPTDIKTF